MTEKPPSSMARYAVWYVLALILLLSIFQYYSAMQQAVEISYSEFRHLVQIKAVDDLTVSTDTITGNLLPKGIDELAKTRQNPDLPQTLAKQFDKKKPIFSAVRLEDPDLVKLLAKDNISYRAVQEKTWLTSLLSWVFPFLLLIGAAPNAIAYNSKQFTPGEFLRFGLLASVMLMVVLYVFVAFVWPMMGMEVFTAK